MNQESHQELVKLACIDWTALLESYEKEDENLKYIDFSNYWYSKSESVEASVSSSEFNTRKRKLPDPLLPVISKTKKKSNSILDYGTNLTDKSKVINEQFIEFLKKILINAKKVKTRIMIQMKII